MVSSTSSFNYMYEFIDDSNNSYRSIVVDAMWMNHTYSSKSSRNIHLDEESNVDAIRFLEFLKYSDEPC
jgi:hypothetical protein